jgi:hypothetical protein
MNDVVLLASGIVIPPIVSFIKKTSWPSRVKFLLSIGVAFAVASAVLAGQGEFGSWSEFVGKVSLVWAESQVIYQLYFDETTMNARLEQMNSGE